MVKVEEERGSKVILLYRCLRCEKLCRSTKFCFMLRELILTKRLVNQIECRSRAITRRDVSFDPSIHHRNQCNKNDFTPHRATVETLFLELLLLFVTSNSMLAVTHCYRIVWMAEKRCVCASVITGSITFLWTPDRQTDLMDTLHCFYRQCAHNSTISTT